MRESAFDLAKKIILGIMFSVLVVIFVTLLILTMDDKFIKDIKVFVKNDTKVLYIANNKNYDKYPESIFKKYDINYKYVNSDKLSKFEKTKLEKIVNSKHLSNIIVIFDSGKVKDAIIDYDSEEKLNEFLIKYEIIPSIIDNISGMTNKISNSIKSESLILYLPYVYSDNIQYQDNILSNISKQYNVNYKKINAYLLSKTQHQKINSVLGISEVNDQIVIFIKNQNIVGSLRGFNRKSEYINKLFEYGYVDEVYNSLNEINYSDFVNELNNDEKTVMLIIKDDCKYCKEVMSVLNGISSSYNLNIDYINVGKIDSEISVSLEDKIKDIGYEDGFSTPLIIITENRKLLDYSIGSSNYEFFKDLFTENGLIK